jgi:glycosyltransferase involved in cell wall biosynthesis
MAVAAILEDPCDQTAFEVEDEASVTAIIPTRGRTELVQRAISSVLHQSYRPLKIILVIDGRDEPTRRLAGEMCEPRLRVVELSRSVGAAQARNIGVDLAASEWVAFLDDDDEWLPRKIELQMKAACASHAPHPVISSRVIVKTTGYDWVSPDRLYTSGEPMSEYLFCRHRFVDGASYMQTSTLLVQRKLMQKIPFPAHLRRHQDWDWLLRAAAGPEVEFHMLPEALALFHVEEGRSSIGRSLDWEASRAWAQEMRHAFTPRAYSFFMANECVSRAVKIRAGGAAYAGLTWEFLMHGHPTPRSVLSLAGFLCIPEIIRTSIRRSVRRGRTPAQTPQSSVQT